MARVLVGLSGGVDSAVSAALLQRAGHEVIGVFIKIWQPEFLECTWKEDRLSAKRVAAHLGVPFMEVDFSEQYKVHVIENMLSEYAQGRTPNPDVLCNRHIKFGFLREVAERHGASHIATGHYARIEKRASVYTLQRGVDPQKDQSYFLWRLNQNDLSGVLFPIGEYTKTQVREYAHRFKLPNAQRPDSQGLCFVGDVPLSDFLQRFITVEPGAVYNKEGVHIGTHKGAALYTVGQRHGFSLNEPSEFPLYVVSIDAGQNALTVSNNPQDGAKKNLCLSDVSWVADAPKPHQPLSFELRYHHMPQPGHFVDTRCVSMDAPQLVAPGQSVVVYEGDQCLGGGVLL